MLNEILEFGPVVGAITLGGSVWAIFSWLDTHFTTQAKGEVASWLREAHDWSKIQETFIKAFNLTFSKRVLSFRGFLRSALVSTTSIALLSLIYVANRHQFWDNEGYLGDIDWYDRVRYFIVMAVLANIPADYISVLLTRVFISISSRFGITLRLLSYVAFCVACVMLYLGLIVLADKTVGLVSEEAAFGITPFYTVGDLFDLENVYEYIDASLRWRPVILWGGASVTPWYEVFSYGPFIYSSLLTMAWLGLYIVCGFLVKALIRSEGAWRLWIKYFDVDKYPIKCIGAVAAALVTILYMVVATMARVLS